MDLSDIDAETIEEIVVRCSRKALEYFRVDTTDLIVENKLAEGFDPVTAADRMVERLLREDLVAAVGELPVIGEEEGVTGDPTKGLAWIIDPIDGTRAFISGQPQWGTLLGLLEDGEPVGGWVHLPVLDETHWALGDTSGSVLNSSRNGFVSHCVSLADATLVSTHPSMFEGIDGERFWELEGSVKLSRFGGDCHNYALLANGDIDLVVENQMETYDILPLVPIVENAGGIVTDRFGDPPLEGGMVIAAATRELHAEAMAMMR